MFACGIFVCTFWIAGLLSFGRDQLGLSFALRCSRSPEVEGGKEGRWLLPPDDQRGSMWGNKVEKTRH